jgi:hypothetical protein
MSARITLVTEKHLARMLLAVIKQQTIELFGDPDDGLILKSSLRTRLSRQKKAVANGERGVDFAVILKRLGL